MSLRMTGPDVQAEQGETVDWTLTLSASASGDATSAVLKVAWRRSVRSPWETVTVDGTETADVALGAVHVLLDTSDLDGLAPYLWEVSAFDSDGELVQRWRGQLFVSSALS